MNRTLALSLLLIAVLLSVVEIGSGDDDAAFSWTVMILSLGAALWLMRPRRRGEVPVTAAGNPAISPSVEVVARGTWLYGGSQRPVFIVRIDSGISPSIAEIEGDLQADGVPKLNSDGQSYYVSFHDPAHTGSFSPDSPGFQTIDNAKEHAESRLQAAVSWR
jgi:hypothetical protein